MCVFFKIWKGIYRIVIKGGGVISILTAICVFHKKTNPKIVIRINNNFKVSPTVQNW